MRFASYLSFETHQTATIKKIEKGNMKYNRCQKALMDNSKESFFSKDPIMSQYYERLELIEAFKIENNVLLKEFDSRLRK
jgi:hypothetical protein